MEKKKPNLRLRLILLYIGSFFVSVTPLVVVFIVNRGKYTGTPSGTVKLCFGGVICLALLALKVIGKLHMPRRVIFYTLLFVMSYFLQALLDDLTLLLGMALLGEFIDLICFQRAVRVTKENIVVGKTADATAAQVEEVIKKYIGRV